MRSALARGWIRTSTLRSSGTANRSTRRTGVSGQWNSTPYSASPSSWLRTRAIRSTSRLSDPTSRSKSRRFSARADIARKSSAAPFTSVSLPCAPRISAGFGRDCQTWA